MEKGIYLVLEFLNNQQEHNSACVDKAGTAELLWK